MFALSTIVVLGVLLTYGMACVRAQQQQQFEFRIQPQSLNEVYKQPQQRQQQPQQMQNTRYVTYVLQQNPNGNTRNQQQQKFVYQQPVGFQQVIPKQQQQQINFQEFVDHSNMLQQQQQQTNNFNRIQNQQNSKQQFLNNQWQQQKYQQPQQQQQDKFQLQQQPQTNPPKFQQQNQQVNRQQYYQELPSQQAFNGQQQFQQEQRQQQQQQQQQQKQQQQQQQQNLQQQSFNSQQQPQSYQQFEPATNQQIQYFIAAPKATSPMSVQASLSRVAAATTSKPFEKQTQPVASISAPSDNTNKKTFTPFLPSYLSEEPSGTNMTETCDRCCKAGEDPCTACCGTRPLLSALALKSTAG